MKASSLAIGDWVEVFQDGKITRKDARRGRVVALSPRSHTIVVAFNYVDYRHFYGEEIPESNVRGISLDLDFMRRNCPNVKGDVFTWFSGAEYEGDEAAYVEVTLREVNDEIDVFSVSANDGESYLFEITTVDELQHLLNLAGINQEITL